MTKKNQNIPNVPNLRFSGFEGEWIESTLNTLCDKIGDGLHGTPSYSQNTGYYFVNGNNLLNGKVNISNNTKQVTQEDWVRSNKNLNDKTLFISINGTIGNVAKYANENLMLGKSVAYLNFKENRDFFYFILGSSNIQKYLISELTGTTIKNLSLKTIRDTKIFYPLLNEQKKISSFLTKIDSRIETQSKIISHLESLIFCLTKKLLCLKLRFSDKNGIEYPDWKTKQLKEILTIGSGRDYKHLAIGKVPVFGTGGLITYVDKYLYKGETVCIGRKGTIDKPMYYNGEIWTVDTLFYTHSFVESEPRFIYHTFRTINWKEYNEASGVPSLSKSTIEKIQINTPSHNEQKKIANFLSSLDEKIEAEKKVLKHYEIQKKYLLNNLFI